MVWCTRVSLFCAATVCLMLIGQCAERLMHDQSKGITFHTWLYIFAILLSSLMIVDNPKTLKYILNFLSLYQKFYIPISRVYSKDVLILFNFVQHYRFVALGTLVSTTVASFFFLMQVIFDSRLSEGTDIPLPPIVELDPVKICLAFGTLLFSSGAATVMPVIQNDMFKFNHYAHNLLVSFACE